MRVNNNTRARTHRRARKPWARPKSPESDFGPQFCVLRPPWPLGTPQVRPTASEGPRRRNTALLSSSSFPPNLGAGFDGREPSSPQVDSGLLGSIRVDLLSLSLLKSAIRDSIPRFFCFPFWMAKRKLPTPCFMQFRFRETIPCLAYRFSSFASVPVWPFSSNPRRRLSSAVSPPAWARSP